MSSVVSTVTLLSLSPPPPPRPRPRPLPPPAPSTLRRVLATAVVNPPEEARRGEAEAGDEGPRFAMAASVDGRRRGREVARGWEGGRCRSAAAHALRDSSHCARKSALETDGGSLRRWWMEGATSGEVRRREGGAQRWISRHRRGARERVRCREELACVWRRRGLLRWLAAAAEDERSINP